MKANLNAKDSKEFYLRLHLPASESRESKGFYIIALSIKRVFFLLICCFHRCGPKQFRDDHQTTKTAAPRIASSFKAINASFASASANSWTCVRTGILAASAKKFRPSSRVLLATLRTTLSP